MYYHLTKLKNVESILKTGLRSKEGLVWVVDNLSDKTIRTVTFVTNMSNQKFAVIKVNPKGCVGYHIIEKYSEKYRHHYFRQELIPPGFLSLEGNYEIKINRISE